jgi:hypothetical protein
MRSQLSFALVALLATAAVAHAAPPRPPSDRGCLLAWNSPANSANHVRLVGAAARSRVSLRAGTTGTDTWTRGSGSTQNAAPACLLIVSPVMVATPHEIRIVTGLWRAGHVYRWSFGPPIRTTRPLGTNATLLADGRVAKIYRR